VSVFAPLTRLPLRVHAYAKFCGAWYRCAGLRSPAHPAPEQVSFDLAVLPPPTDGGPVPTGGLSSTGKTGTETVAVPAFTLPEENPGDPTQSGVYKIVVTAFLDSQLGAVGYDMMGYAEGPIIKVESPI